MNISWSEYTDKLFDVNLTKDFEINHQTINAKVIVDSTNSRKTSRITTVQITAPRIILSEINTHRIISKNFSSSRAIPAKKIRSKIRDNMFVPVYWGKNQRGMHANEELCGLSKAFAKYLWRTSGNVMLFCHWFGEQMGVHKQILNRIVEPWSTVTGLLTSTEWDNFFRLRYSRLAQPEMIVLTKCIHDAIKESTPKILTRYNAHLPYVDEEEILHYDMCDCVKISVARSCRVSYDNMLGKKSVPEEDLKLFDRLLKDHHLSPFEHVAFLPNSKIKWTKSRLDPKRNFNGFYQLRGFVEPVENLTLLKDYYNIDLMN